MKIKVIYFFLFLLVFANKEIYSQDSLKANFPTNHFAILFQVEDLLEITSLYNGVLSVKYLFKNADQLRLSISFGLSKYESDNTLFSKEINDKTYHFSTYAQYLFSITSYYDFLLFTGGGPFFGYYYQDVFSLESGNNLSIGYRKFIDFGISFIIGIEWFLRKNLSLSIESGFALSYLKESKYSSTSNDYIDQHYNIKESGTRLGIALYF